MKGAQGIQGPQGISGPTIQVVYFDKPCSHCGRMGRTILWYSWGNGSGYLCEVCEALEKL